MKTYTLIILLAIFSSVNNLTYTQSNQTVTNSSSNNSFGIFELFDGVKLYHHRFYKVNDAPTEYIRIDLTPLTVKISDDSNVLKISDMNGTLILKKTEIPGKLKIGGFYQHQKVKSAVFLEDGSLQISFNYKNTSDPKRTFIEIYELAGLGLKKSYYEYTQGKNLKSVLYYETEKEHRKTSDPKSNQRHARIIAIGEEAKANNDIFRFAAAEGTLIEIKTKNLSNNGKVYITLYSSDGEILKEKDGNGSLLLWHKIPEDGFYYISTMRENEKDNLEIKLLKL